MSSFSSQTTVFLHSVSTFILVLWGVLLRLLPFFTKGMHLMWPIFPTLLHCQCFRFRYLLLPGRSREMMRTETVCIVFFSEKFLPKGYQLVINLTVFSLHTRKVKETLHLLGLFLWHRWLWRKRVRARATTGTWRRETGRTVWGPDGSSRGDTGVDVIRYRESWGSLGG